MNYKAFIKETPVILTILPTHKCTASCKNCCFGCTPKIKHKMSYDEIIYHIDHAVEIYPSLKVCVFTGGECFLLGDDLDKCISYATKLGLSTRVVTNGYWADSYDNAYKRLSTLVNNGLKEINFSTGDEHQEYVDFGNIINGIKAALELKIEPPICIAVESWWAAKFTKEHVESNKYLSKLIEKSDLHVLSGSWITLRSDIPNCATENHTIVHTIGDSEGCDNLFRTISINPYSQLLACCGVTAEYNKFLKLGNLKKYSLEYLFDAQFEDMYKLWLYTLGPKHIYEKLSMYLGNKPKELNHSCAYCVEAIKNEKNINAIKRILPSQIPGIFLKLESMNLIKT